MQVILPRACAYAVFVFGIVVPANRPATPRTCPVCVEVRGFEILQSRLHGHVAAVSAMLHCLDMQQVLDPRPSRERDIVEAMIVARVVAPQTKLATTRWWQQTTLPEDLGISDATEDELYDAMAWLLARQPRIETELAGRRLQEGGLLLYDVSSSYYEGRHCPLAVPVVPEGGKGAQLLGV